MSNLSYCSFQNTLSDLEDCYEHLNDDLVDKGEEDIARNRLVKLCKMIVREME